MDSAPLEPWDKVGHLVIYSIFALLGCRVIYNRQQFIFLCVGIIAYSGLMEVVQSQADALMQDPKSPEVIAERYGLEVEDSRAWFADIRWSQDFDMPEEELKYVITSLNNLGIVSAPNAKPIDVFAKL